ncbi:MAG: hypothetical protein M0017_11535 [Desulfobacteraceae bacterium]|nr:hypothetical protein [Desulfobacteraceae bacterium]
MTAQNIPCWKITNCRRNECCLGQHAEEKQCWEVASELDDYRSAMNVCKDCIVYITKQANSVLTEAEITVIMERKGCILTQKCPNYSPRPD